MCANLSDAIRGRPGVETWHHVFQTHPKSIVRSVAKNVVGPALSDATDGGSDELDVLTKVEYIRLRTNAAVIKQLEAAFSLKYKDALSRTSQLTWAESWRFARAIYRIMLYCAVFRMPDDEDQLNELEENQRDEIEGRRVAMLSEYSTQELAIAYESGGDYFEDEDDLSARSDMLISTGPAAVLEAYHRKNGDSMVEAIGYTVWISGPFMLLIEFFSCPLQRIWAAREVTPPRSPAALQGSLLDEATYRSTPCDQCGLESPKKLRHENNWDSLHLNIRELLLGNLSGNFTEMELLDEAKPGRDIPKLISELYALKTEEYKAWNKSDALCDACLTKFLSAHLHLWLLDRKLKGDTHIRVWLQVQDPDGGYSACIDEKCKSVSLFTAQRNLTGCSIFLRQRPSNRNNVSICPHRTQCVKSIAYSTLFASPDALLAVPLFIASVVVCRVLSPTQTELKTIQDAAAVEGGCDNIAM
ncbi:hypothetical protein B0H13DRAFT_1865860 [Mycena leptocephala]|nr:hypothetical protein B0H13DRAFT_1865860 [Mycena leptocephala]